MTDPCTHCGLRDCAKECPKLTAGCSCLAADDWNCATLSKRTDVIFCHCQCHDEFNPLESAAGNENGGV